MLEMNLETNINNINFLRYMQQKEKENEENKMLWRESRPHQEQKQENKKFYPGTISPYTF